MLISRRRLIQCIVRHWEILRLRGIPARILGLLTGLYSGAESAVKWGRDVSSFFPVDAGVRQGCVLAPTLGGEALGTSGLLDQD